MNVHTPIEDVFSELKKHMDNCLASLRRAEIHDIILVKIERVVWTTEKGFYGSQDKKVDKNELNIVVPANKIVFIDEKNVYVFFNGRFGYRFKMREINAVKMEDIKSFGEPVTLEYAKHLLFAQEIQLGLSSTEKEEESPGAVVKKREQEKKKLKAQAEKAKRENRRSEGPKPNADKPVKRSLKPPGLSNNEETEMGTDSPRKPRKRRRRNKPTPKAPDVTNDNAPKESAPGGTESPAAANDTKVPAFAIPEVT